LIREQLRIVLLCVVVDSARRHRFVIRGARERRHQYTRVIIQYRQEKENLQKNEKNVRRTCPQYPSRATHLAPLPETPLEASTSFAGLPVALAPSSVATPPFPPPPSTTTRVASESPAPSLFKAGDSARVGGGSAAAEGVGAVGAVGAANAAGGGAATPPYAPPAPTGAAGAGAYGWYPDIAADLLK
jgi:hypothetical protein